MKRTFKSMQGVTLLEIMLVLAIASMVIVMSMKYYQSASANQKVAAGVSAVTGLVAGGESVLAAKGTLATVAADILTYMPAGVLPSSPWGGAIAVANVAANSYTITMTNINVAACSQMLNLVNQNTKTVMACPSGVITVTE